MTVKMNGSSMPCNVRQTSNSANEPDCAVSNVAIVRVIEAPTTTRLRPKRSESAPAIGAKPATASNVTVTVRPI